MIVKNDTITRQFSGHTKIKKLIKKINNLLIIIKYAKNEKDSKTMQRRWI
jgi:hypothetical protein